MKAIDVLAEFQTQNSIELQDKNSIKKYHLVLKTERLLI